MKNVAEIKKLRSDFAGVEFKSNLLEELLKSLVAAIAQSNEILKGSNLSTTATSNNKRQIYLEGRWQNVKDIAFFSSPN
ncbi:MAG: hypothetical protein K2X27_18855 [Candidatus Obscuribacterales bacterium]|nr:hypothetical protein [Candidatus Obscuribacterales bacterium]